MVKSSQYKIFSDPVHGFITIPKGVILNLIDHPYIQRLRRIRQLGLGYLVFPAAEHSRFSHAIGAMELGQRVLKNLREKNATISDAEVEGTLIAILLHDVGHGPLSHTLEHSFDRKPDVCSSDLITTDPTARARLSGLASGRTLPFLSRHWSDGAGTAGIEKSA